MAKILLAGNDDRLLETRAAVLARTEATVICCYPNHAIKRLETECFDLIVLCHSLTDHQIADITHIAHQKLPAAKILRVVSALWPEHSANSTNSYETSSYDPGSLIRLTTELLQPNSFTSQDS